MIVRENVGTKQIQNDVLMHSYEARVKKALGCLYTQGIYFACIPCFRTYILHKTVRIPCQEKPGSSLLCSQIPLAIFVTIGGKLPSFSMTIQPFISLGYLDIRLLALQTKVDIRVSIGASLY